MGVRPGVFNLDLRTKVFDCPVCGKAKTRLVVDENIVGTVLGWKVEHHIIRVVRTPWATVECPLSGKPVHLE